MTDIATLLATLLASLLLVVACRHLNDRDRAQMECDVAGEVIEQLGAAPALVQLDRLLAVRLQCDNGACGDQQQQGQQRFNAVHGSLLPAKET